MKFSASALMLLLVHAGCSLHQPVTVPRLSASLPPFILTFWCGPPLAEFDDSRAEQIASAGFNVVGPPCEGGRDRADQLRALNVAARHGLQMWIIDDRVAQDAPKSPDWEAGAAAVVADYGAHPALGGYLVVDEPSADDFDAVAQVADWLRAHDPARIAYVNLLPGYIDAKGLGTASYQEYIDTFVTRVRPRLLSFDYYPFLKEKDRGGFLRNLGTVRDAALRFGVPFMLIVQAMPHFVYRDPTETELAWQVFHALAYGARGISYFAYWTPVDVVGSDRMDFRYGLVEGGRLTRHYFEAARLNRVTAAIAEELRSFRSIGVADSTGEIGIAFPIGPIDGIEGGPVTAGLFDDSGRRLAVLLVNRDFRYEVSAAVRLRADAAAPEAYDPASRTWSRPDSLVFRLAPGAAQLLRWS